MWQPSPARRPARHLARPLGSRSPPRRAAASAHAPGSRRRPTPNSFVLLLVVMSRGDTLLGIPYRYLFRQSLLTTGVGQPGSLGAADSAFSVDTLATLMFGGQSLPLIHCIILLTSGRARRGSSVEAPCR